MHKVRKNKKNIGIVLFVFLNFFIFSQKAYTQEITVSTGKTKLAINEKFTISIHFPKENKREFKAYHQYFFPDLTDFEKGRTIYIEEEDPKSYRITQYYKPRKAGNFTINSIRIKIKDKVYASPKVTVKVSAVKNPKPEPEPEIKKDEEDLEFDEPKLDAMLHISSSKKNVYMGEGFSLTLSFLVSAQNKAELTFIDLAEQRKEMIKKMKSTGCLVEEVAAHEELKLDTVTIKEKKYLQWKLYEAVFFPIDSNNIKIPSLQFSMLTYALAKNKQESMERKTMLKKFSTSSFIITVSPLPQQKGKEQLPVGYFRLAENISPNKFHTGKSFKYTFTVIGEGNIAALPEPIVTPSDYFDIYAPKIKQESAHQQGKLVGAKTFTYYVTPKEPGDFQLANFFKWPYFNMAQRRADTLRSALSLKVRGESLKNNYISVNNPGDFYSRIHTDTNQIRLLSKDDEVKYWTNLSILLMLVITAMLVFRK
ncbi:MAG TPA: BatD family protein [Cytophagaceae bacterium]|nr:BatD family protein [Cytophagaceae bacterium]